MPQQPDYPFIREWGRLIGSYDYYIEDRIAQAREENAPRNALYRQEDGTWITTDDITSATARIQLGLEPLPPQEPDLATVLADLANGIRLMERFRDLFGLMAIQQVDDHTLALRFSTDWSARLTIELQPPDPSS